jgi:hypothetical protein
MKHTTTILIALASLTLACGPMPDGYLADAGISPVMDLPVDAGPERNPILECCDCLADTVDPIGDPCVESYGQCVDDLEDGVLPGSNRCGVGGEPYCSASCGEVWPG